MPAAVLYKARSLKLIGWILDTTTTTALLNWVKQHMCQKIEDPASIFFYYALIQLLIPFPAQWGSWVMVILATSSNQVKSVTYSKTQSQDWQKVQHKIIQH